MIVKELTLTYFKNYKNQNVVFHSDMNVLVGHNGMGKTNLVDAIYFTAFCKSNFQRQDKNIVTHDESFYRIEADLVNTDNKPLDYKAIVEVGKPKRISINQVEYDRISHHLGLIPLIMIGPNDIHTLIQGSEDRRRLIDSCICQFDKIYTQNLIEYTRILKHRNAYLKSLDQIDRVDMALLESFNHQMDSRAQHIHKVRASFIQDLNPAFAQVYQGISAGAELASLEYKSALDAQSFLALCKDNLKKDLFLKRTSAGVHKDDLELILDKKPLKTFASQGQLKSYVLSLKIAQYEYLQKIGEETPMLLLDDIFDKLDRQRVKNLILYLVKNKKGQIFITDTHLDRVSSILEELEISHKVFEIEQGSVKQEYEK